MRHPVEDRDARVAELLDEYLAAVRGGRPIDRATFLAAHGEFAGELAAGLQALDFVGCAAASIAQEGGRGEEPRAGTLGDFRLIREVGRGGMGVVYEAEQISLDRRVALKVLPFAAVLDERQLQRFKHEAQAAALLHHSNIVPVYSVGADRGVHYYAMEFVEGRTLAAVIGELREGKRSSRGMPATSAEARALISGGGTGTRGYCEAVARLGVQAAEALDHAHQQGVVHRDIKPANLMVDAGRRLRITDFGLAQSRANSQLTLTGAIVGTLGYMSPEQALGKRVPVDHRTDVYSLGVTMLEMLTLESAFTGDDPRQVLHDVAFKDPLPPRRSNPAVPPALETIVLKAVAKNPESRFGTAQEMADDLRRYLSDQPIRARREPLLERVTLWARRHRTGVAGATCVLLVAVVALAFDSVRGAAARRWIEGAFERERRSAAQARAEAERADASLEKARAAVDRMLTQLGAEHLAGIPGLESVRRKVLEEALTLCDDLLALGGDDPRVRLDAAKVMRRVATIYTQMGDLPAAERLIVRALSETDVLLPQEGPRPQALDEAIELVNLRALVCSHGSRIAEAITHQTRAVALAEGGSVPRLAILLATQSSFLVNAGRREEADRAARRALELFESCTPDVLAAAPREDLCHAIVQAACRAKGSREDARAESLLRRAVDLSAKDKDSAADCEPFREYTSSHLLLGRYLLGKGRVEEAIPFVQAASASSARSASEFPRYPRGAYEAAECRGVLAAALARADRAEESKRALAEAHALCDRVLAEFPDVERVTTGVARALGIVAEELAAANCVAESHAAFRRSADLRRALAAAASGAGPWIRLAATLSSWIRNLQSTMRLEEHVELAREAVRAAEEATKAPDAVIECRYQQQHATFALGNSLVRAGRPAEAVESYGRCADDAQLLVADDLGGPRGRHLVASALYSKAEALWSAGRPGDAAAPLSEALGVYERLLADFPGDMDVAADHAAALFLSAKSAWGSGGLAEGEDLVRRAIRGFERAASEKPALYRSRLGASFMLLGWIHQAAGRLDEAERATRQALLELRGCGEEDSLLLGDIATCCDVLGDILGSMSRASEAERCMRESIEARARLAAADPAATRHAGGLANAHAIYASFLFRAGRAPEAEREAMRVLEIGEPFLGRDPAPSLRLAMSNAYQLLMCVHGRAARAAEAIDACERGLAWLPGRWDLLTSLIWLRADGPDPAHRDTRRAVTLAREAIDAPPIAAEISAVLGPGRGLSLRPIEARHFLGIALVCDGQWEEGLRAFEKARELGSTENGAAWLYQALAHARLGNREAASRLLDMAEAWHEKHEPQGPQSAARRSAEVAELLRASQPR